MIYHIYTQESDKLTYFSLVFLSIYTPSNIYTFILE